MIIEIRDERWEDREDKKSWEVLKRLEYIIGMQGDEQKKTVYEVNSG